MRVPVFAVLALCTGIVCAGVVPLYPAGHSSGLDNIETLQNYTKQYKPLTPPHLTRPTEPRFRDSVSFNLTMTGIPHDEPKVTPPGVVEQPKKLRGPCCDGMECDLDCSALLDCGQAKCPLDPRGPIIGGRLVSLVEEEPDDCHNRAPYGQECACTCRCVCIYHTGEVVWLEWPTPGATMRQGGQDAPVSFAKKPSQ